MKQLGSTSSPASHLPNSTTLAQFLGLLTAVGDLFSLKSSLETAEELAAAMAALPASSTALQTLGSRITVLVPLEDILMNDFETKLNFSSVVIDIIKNDLLIDVNRIYGIETREIVSLLSSVKMLKKLVQLRNNMEDTASIVKRSTVISPIVKLYQAIQEMGPETFTENLLQSVNYTYLLSKINNMRMEALLNTDWLATMKVDISAAVGSLSQLSKLGAVMDLSKIITGEVDPVTFLTGSVQLLQMKLWIDLAKSFSKILEEGMPLVAGSELEDDLQRVVDGINSLQAAKNLGIVDFTIPTYSFITNWTEMQQYMEEDLMMSAEVIEALRHSELNLMALLSLEDVTLEEVICEGSQVERVVTLPRDTQVTPAAISDSLCNSTNAQGLAETFLQHLNLAPLIVTLTNFGINSSLTSHGTTLEEVMDAVNTLVESSVYLPTLTNTFSALRDLRYTLIEPPVSEKLVMNNSQSMLRDITSPSFLTRAGQALCGRSLDLVPDSLGVLSVNFKEKEPNNTEPSSDVCETLFEDIKSLPGGSVLLHFIKPLLMGKIFYTPDNYITQAIIHQANETFAKVEKQQEALKQLQKSTARLATTSSQDSDLQKLKESLQLPWVQSLMQQLLPSSHSISLTEQINYTSPQLTEASEFAKEFSDILEVGVSLLSCLELQRFVPASDEAELLELASHAAKEKMFLAGIVFDGAGETGDTETKIPAHLTYTLRVDYEKSPSTFHLGPKFWQPGAYAHMALHMKYLQGFLQLQETIEEAILKLQHKNSNFSKTAASLKSQDNDFLSVIDKDIGNKSKFLRSKNMKQLSLGVNNLPKTIEPRHLLSRRTKRATTAATLTEEEENLLLNLPIYTKQQPYPCYEKDDFMSMLNSSPVLSCVFSFMAFTIFIMSLISQLVQERESRNRQLQEVMGLRLWLDHLVWFFYSLLHLVIILLVVTFAIKFGGLQPKVDFWVLFTFLFCYGLSIIAFCYLVACLVPSTVLATFVGVMSLLVFSVPFVSITLIQVKTPLSIIRFSCLLPPSAFGFGFQIICQYELLLKGADFNNLWTPPLRGSDMTLGVALVMLLVDTAIFFLISAIVTTFRNEVSQHLPSSGKSDPTPQPAPFSEQASLKRSNEFTFSIFQEDAVHVLDLDPGLKQSLKKGLSIVGLRRIFKQRGRSKVAITNLNLELYEGQVLVLLGHNGAGKTTIISMLTRELKPTAGSIQVYGHDISSAWNKARRLIGLCPQQTVLFPFLTVQETLEYYSMLKESTTSMGQIDTNMVLHNMGLFYHRDYLVCHLSEGLSRRLSMAIAFTGNSKLIILDEPTAGVDPAARSAIWEVISNNRAGRTILLTTHHLDEAETLADRVAILHQGRLLCVGSPLALKSEYGLGYSLTLSNRILSEESSSEETADLDNNIKPSIDGTFSAKKGELWQLLKSYVPNVRLLESVNGEVTYSLPLCDNHGNSNR
ncbi:phospholipid-transporting ATPase ABCA1-like isoform X4 [Homarus americanus]|uniref:phospholipid-transporting ATPase ABCA1-like isoform X4 n=1 Tax=Homarus americanus TaxID=6706 RepID=UPI001C46479E|nr:phospholipid-transporting ATPase ABCA1-like isoform X4 [Homarus americanus]